MCPENLQHAFAKLASILLFALAMVTMPSAHAQTYHILHSFTGAGDGGYPQAGVTIDRAGNLYGTTASGGPYQYNGTVYELKPRDGNWTLDTLYDFGSGGVTTEQPLMPESSSGRTEPSTGRHLAGATVVTARYSS